MTDKERAEVYNSLKRESDTLAGLATELLEQKWQPRFSGLSPSDLPGQESKPGIHGHGFSPANVEELIAMIRSGFVRLGNVIALSVMVDEPGLIADDIVWLVQMFAVHNVVPESEGWVADLLYAYSDACKAVLPESDCACISDSIERALVLMGKPDNAN